MCRAYIGLRRRGSVFQARRPVYCPSLHFPSAPSQRPGIRLLGTICYIGLDLSISDRFLVDPSYSGEPWKKTTYTLCSTAFSVSGRMLGLDCILFICYKSFLRPVAAVHIQIIRRPCDLCITELPGASAVHFMLAGHSGDQVDWRVS